MSNLHVSSSRLVVSLALALSLTGCGSKNERSTAPVQGTVTFKGKPLNTGSLLFVPSGGGPTAQANIRPDGTYSMTTYRDGDGAVIGNHDVIIMALEDPAGGKLPEDAKKGYDSAQHSLIPEKFGDLAKSGLKVEVTADVTHVVDFDLDKGTLTQSKK